jgi:hypothetical protein
MAKRIEFPIPQRRRKVTEFGSITPPPWHVTCFSHLAARLRHFGGVMAKMIEFYIPRSFRKVSKWSSPGRGKLLVFPPVARKSA